MNEPVIIDYGPYLDGDLWPSESAGLTQWVGEIPPAKAANCIGKLLRWAEQQPALDHGQELENVHTVRASRLYRFLAARATYSDFVDADNGVTANGVIAAVHDEVPYGEQLAVYAIAVANNAHLEPGDLVRSAISLHDVIDRHGFTIVKKES